MEPRPVKLAIFDLDDTLSDHRHSSVCGIKALQEHYPSLAARPLEGLTSLHLNLLNRWHGAILSGAETPESARPKRYREFFAASGMEPDDAELHRAIVWYQQGYSANRRAVPGAPEVLRELKRRGLVTAVLTNHHSAAEQRGKLEECGIAHLVDRLFVSVEVGHVKPDRLAFEKVLDALSCEPQRAVMVGDSLGTDIEGALAAGLRAVWLNRFHECVPDGLNAVVIDSFEPVENAVQVILAAGRAAAPADKQLGCSRSCCCPLEKR
jgi:HAD superfamily hydrolase (TIGR01549 family)